MNDHGNINTTDEKRLLDLVRDVLENKSPASKVARKLAIRNRTAHDLVSVLRMIEHERDGSPAIELHPPVVQDPVGPNDEIAVILEAKKLKIDHLFSDGEIEGGRQEGTFVCTFNSQFTTIGWMRKGVVNNWQQFENTQERVLFAGNPKGVLDIDVALIESDEPERQFFEKLAKLLETAGGLSGFVPGFGTAASAGLSLGAAVARLIKATIKDDSELRFLGAIGGKENSLQYGEYSLVRKTSSRQDIQFKFKIVKLATNPLTNRRVEILLHDVVLDLKNGNQGPLGNKDRILVDASVTGTPKDDSGEIRVGSIDIDHPFSGRNGGTLQTTLSIRDKLLYDGPWGKNISFSANVSAVPREIPQEEILDVINKSGALVSSIVPQDSMDKVRRGFEIAESVRSTIVNYVPSTKFSGSLSTIFYSDNTVTLPGLVNIRDINNSWESYERTIVLPNGYGNAIFKLSIRLSNVPAPVVRKKKFAVLSSNSTDIPVLSGVSGQQIRILACEIYSESNSEIEFQSIGTSAKTAISGSMPIQGSKGQALIMSHSPDGHFETKQGESLILRQRQGPAQLDGYLVYEEF